MDFIMVGLGGFLGSIARYAVYLVCKNLTAIQFPIATLLVNFLGCTAMGYVSVFFISRMAQSNFIYLFLAVGFLGGFTTFSAFSYETLTLFKEGFHSFAFLNVFANFGLSLLGIYIGKLLCTL